jgi:hypothetical protein
MPGIQDLLQLAQGAGGGAPAPQGPPGGGVPPQALLQKLQELMQDPVARQGMMQHAQATGMIPGGGAPPGAGTPMPPQGAPPGMEAPPGAPPQGDGAEAMATDAIDSAGGWEGTQSPTQTDIERLMNDPSEENIKSFDEQFGDGAAEKLLEEEGGEGSDEQAKEQASGGEAKESDEY